MIWFDDEDGFATWMKPLGIRAPPCTNLGTRKGSGFWNISSWLVIVMIMIMIDHRDHDLKGTWLYNKSPPCSQGLSASQRQLGLKKINIQSPNCYSWWEICRRFVKIGSEVFFQTRLAPYFLLFPLFPEQIDFPGFQRMSWSSASLVSVEKIVNVITVVTLQLTQHDFPIRQLLQKMFCCLTSCKSKHSHFNPSRHLTPPPPPFISTPSLVLTSILPTHILPAK